MNSIQSLVAEQTGLDNNKHQTNRRVAAYRSSGSLSGRSPWLSAAVTELWDVTPRAETGQSRPELLEAETHRERGDRKLHL